jgi:serine/threonine protein kinase
LDPSSSSQSNELQHGILDLSHFHEVDHIGKGAHGAVNLWQDNTSDRLIAVKNVSLQDRDITDEGERVLREVRSLMRFHHPILLSHFLVMICKLIPNSCELQYHMLVPTHCNLFSNRPLSMSGLH